MKRNKLFITIIMILVSGCSKSSLATVLNIGGQNYDPFPTPAKSQESIPGACTSFTSQKEDTVLFGNNEDYTNPNTYIWVVPSSEEGYGGVYLGYQVGRPQGGINEKGLAFDGLALPPAPLNYNPERTALGSSFTEFWATIMANCATVDEAIQVSTGYNWGRTISHQVIIADVTGDSAVISAGPDRELAITRKPAGDGYLVATNFNLANPENTDSSLPCWRFETATSMLEKIQKVGELSVGSCEDILDAVHVEGLKNNTLYSNIFDLRNGVVYLFYWHQFGEVVTLNVGEEVAKGSSSKPIKELFSESTLDKVETETLRYQGEIPLVEEHVASGWLIFSSICLLVLSWDLVHGKRVPVVLILFWGLLTFFLGPIGLWIYWFSYRQPRRKSSAEIPGWKRALGGSGVSTAGYATTFLAMLLYFYFFNPNGSSGIASLLIPFVVSLLVFRAPLVVSLTGGKYRIAVGRSFFTETISTMIAVASIIWANNLLNRYLGDFYQAAFNPGSTLFWGMLSTYALVNLITIYPYHLWLVRKGIFVWSDKLEMVNEKNEMGETGKALSFRGGWLVLTMSVAFLVLVITVSQ